MMEINLKQKLHYILTSLICPLKMLSVLTDLNIKCYVIFYHLVKKSEKTELNFLEKDQFVPG